MFRASWPNSWTAKRPHSQYRDPHPQPAHRYTCPLVSPEPLAHGAHRPAACRPLAGIEPIDKMTFIAQATSYSSSVSRRPATHLILCGIEAHICLSDRNGPARQGLAVHIVADAISPNRRQSPIGPPHEQACITYLHRNGPLELLRTAGIKIPRAFAVDKVTICLQLTIRTACRPAQRNCQT